MLSLRAGHFFKAKIRKRALNPKRMGVFTSFAVCVWTWSCLSFMLHLSPMVALISKLLGDKG
ncbi:hypothetical protein JCM10003_304 [Bacteroides pyogenes JCM 10003]|nr:hypothetical protein JCM10003_304 [Bacteroides pyogenes JCM 10003]